LGIFLLDGLDYRWGFAAKTYVALSDHCNFYCDLLVPCEHAGAYAVALIAIYLACVLLERWDTRRALFLYAASTAAVLSDRLIIAEFVVPVIVALIVVGMFRVAGKRAVLLLIGIILASAATAHFLENAIHLAPIPQLYVIDRHVALFARQVGMYIVAHPVQSAEVTLSCILFFACAPSVYRAVRAKAGAEGASSQTLIFLWTYSFFALSMSFCAGAMIYNDFASYRYFVPTRFLLLPFVVLCFFRLRASGTLVKFFSMFALLCAFVSLVAARTLLPGSVSAQPKDFACLMHLRERYNLEAGMAEFWYALPLTMASGGWLQVDQVRPDGTLNYWQNDRFWYTHSLRDPSAPPAYRFILTVNLDAGALLRRYGSPDRIVACTDSAVWIYDGTRLSDAIGRDARSLGW
jgi:hypothetical protein